MRPLSGFAAAAALAGVALAGKESADVYKLPSPSHTELDSLPHQSLHELPRELVRHIILQRLSRDGYGSVAMRDLPTGDDTLETDESITYLNVFGRSPPSIFESSQHVEPAQLVILLEGVTADNSAQLRKALDMSNVHEPSFTVPQPPSAKANDGLIADLLFQGVSSKKDCTIEGAINPNDESCWDKPALSTVLRLDAQKSPDAVAYLSKNMNRLANFVSSGELEALLVLLPESSRHSKLASWSSTRPSSSIDLRRRDNELVISDVEPPSPAPTSGNSPSSSSSNEAFWADNQAKASKTRIPACFASLNTCETRTNNCSGGHGRCVDRYANDTKAKQPCFACHCMRTVVLNGTEQGAFGKKTTQWAGSMCQKKDVSVQFWLLAGFTIGIVGVVTFAIGMLYSVGEEKLPGVIGAGVSRGPSK
ncbi:hypothetical protein GE09DRAFT_951202 [Coniochaeta sp. 2T2.1]|nr:hypothetical protein GE09DRAFT_951202 [Coniochaeta sp. 2T2.1]